MSGGRDEAAGFDVHGPGDALPSPASAQPAQRRVAGDRPRGLRLRRRGRSVAIRSFHFLPSLATLGNAICGFGAIYVASFHPSAAIEHDPWAIALGRQQYVTAAYLIFLAMLFDAIDGRLARFTRHTTDFGGQLDSLADVISFGVAPAYLALQVLKFDFSGWHPPLVLSRLIWAIGALYMSCAALRLARFNTANEHGEQHHMSFLGLPSPGAGGAVAAFVLMHQQLRHEGLNGLGDLCLYLLPLMVLGTGLLMVSNIRYPHFVNRYLRGRKSLHRIVIAVALVLLLVVAHQYVIAFATIGYALSGPVSWLWVHARARTAAGA